jgi:hypothetical protein
MPGGISAVPIQSNIIPSGMENVADAIFKVASNSAADSIDHAIQSFASQWSTTTPPNWSALPEGNAVQPQGFIDAPQHFFKHALETAPHAFNKFSEIFPMSEVLAHLRDPGLDFRSGLLSFMKCGIKEALGGLKVGNNVANTAAEPLPLNELLIPEKLKTVDPGVLQSSLRVAKDMFSVLDKLLGESSNMDLNKLRQIRC